MSKEIVEEIIKLNGLNEVLNSLQLHVKAPKGKNNAFGKYKYRTAEDILASLKDELVKPHYPKNCVLLTNVELKDIQNRLFVCVTATLKVGNEEAKSQGLAEHGSNKKGMDEAQLTGSTTTYARKYALQNLLGIDESEDDIDAKDNTKKNIEKPQTNYRDKLNNAAQGFGDNMKETLRNQNQIDYENIVKQIKEAGSVFEIEGISQKEKSKINRLFKHAPDLFDKLKKLKIDMITELDPENEEVAQANLMQAG